jgi:hypothetical protein
LLDRIIFKNELLLSAFSGFVRAYLKGESCRLKATKPKIRMSQVTQQSLVNIWASINRDVVSEVVKPINTRRGRSVNFDIFLFETIVIAIILPRHVNTSFALHEYRPLHLPHSSHVRRDQCEQVLQDKAYEGDGSAEI